MKYIVIECMNNNNTVCMHVAALKVYQLDHWIANLDLQ